MAQSIARGGFAARLRACRRQRGLGTAALAKALGVSKSSITNWETGVSFPGHALLVPLCELLGATPNELYGFSAREALLPEGERQALGLYRRLGPLDRANVCSLMRAMLDNAAAALREECLNAWRVRPRLYDRVCAGSGTELFGDGGGEPFFLPDTPETRGADAIITVTGDSMEPTFCDGQDLLVRYSQEIRPGEIGIFVLDGQGTVKEYRPDGLHPHNPDYPVIRPEEGMPIRCVGRVLGAVTSSMRPDRERLRVLQELYAEGLLAP